MNISQGAYQPMSLDSSKLGDSRTLNSIESEPRTRQFLSTISRDLEIASEIAANVRISDTGNLPSVFAVSDFATAAVAAACAPQLFESATIQLDATRGMIERC
jgi:hypothetical protein